MGLFRSLAERDAPTVWNSLPHSYALLTASLVLGRKSFVAGVLSAPLLGFLCVTNLLLTYMCE